MSQRQEATQELLYFIDRFAPGSNNKAIYEDYLKNLSDKEFDVFMQSLDSGETTLSLFIPNLSEHAISMENNLSIAEELGHDFFQHLLLTDPLTGQVTKTPVKHMVIDLPLRRQAQMLYKKMSIPENNKVVDERSGQPTGPSKGSRMSYPELQVNAAKGLDSMILEMIKFRGGDVKAYNAMNKSIAQTGEASLDNIVSREPTTVKAKQTLSVYLKAMHLDNNLI